MSKQDKSRKPPVPSQPDDAGILAQALDFIRKQMGKLADDVAEFNRQRKENQEEIRRGARRTSGRIV